MQLDVEIIPGNIQKGSTPRRCPDISKIEKLGFKENFNLNEGLKETITWYQQNN